MELFKKPFPPLGLSNTGRNQALMSQLRSETSTCCNSLLYSPQVPDGPENRANCRIPTPKPRQRPRSKSDHSNQGQREQGERNCAASYQVNRVLGQHHLNISHCSVYESCELKNNECHWPSSIRPAPPPAARSTTPIKTSFPQVPRN